MRKAAEHIISGLIVAIVSIVVTNYVNKAEQEDRRTQTELNKRRAFYEQINLHLEGSYAAFKNQIIARNRLVELFERNHGPLAPLQYEALFRKYYPEMNEDERVLFQLIRGITITSLYKHNVGMVGLLENHPEYRKEIPEFKALHEHLDLWLSKYKGVVENRDVCLVYIGVEERKPFPSGINEKVEDMLAEIQRFGKT